MQIIKCKMCGGDIEMNVERTYGTCSSCSSTMTLPNANDERKVNLFNRANHFRRLNDFDRALAAYENILDDDITNSEAHWGAVLSRYGIEYVEDPITHKRVPTCHRVQSEPILLDSDYLSALENAADTYTRSLYEEEAKNISEIQKGILAISRKEKPYDIFICYKESSNSGSRTKDSTIAQDIYYNLIEEGYEVFFAKITLEEKLGCEYEPYIFAALNSAKIMIVVGTKPEYFNATWVKNEWTRYLSIMKKDTSKLLIPCYCDMDAYDLPEELSMLQGQDISKIGFIQDLERGLKKVLGGVESGKSADVTQGSAINMNVNPLLDRAFICLEDGEWGKADELLENALNLEPRNAKAYIGKLMIEMQVASEKELSNCKNPIDSGNYEKAIRFANEDYKKEIISINDTITNRIIQEKKEDKYLKAMKKMELHDSKVLSKNILEITTILQEIGDYKDSIQLKDKYFAIYEQVKEQEAEETNRINIKREIKIKEATDNYRIKYEIIVAEKKPLIDEFAELGMFQKKRKNEIEIRIAQIHEELGKLKKSFHEELSFIKSSNIF